MVKNLKIAAIRVLLTINLSVVYMAQDVMNLMRATSITRAIGRGGGVLKIETLFLGAELAASEASAIWAQISPSNGFARIKIIKSKRHINNREINS